MALLLDILKVPIYYTLGIMSFIVLVAIYSKTTFSLYKNCYKKIRNGIIIIKSYRDLKEINRDIDVKYSPAVLSYLMDQKVEINKDITSTLLNLYARRVIDIQEKDNKYVIKKGKNEEILSQDEQYIYDCFVKNEEFRMETWINVIRREYFKYKFDDGRKINLIPFYILNILAIIIIIWILVTIILNIPEGERENYTNALIFIPTIIILFTFAGGVFTHAKRKKSIENQLLLTKEGKNEIKKWIKFKRFIKQYTLIEERTIEETQIYEKYIPYAMALGINKNYKDLEIIEKADIIKFIVNSNINGFNEVLRNF